MTPAKLRELAAAINPPDRLAVLIESPATSDEPVSTATASEALLWAAEEIERLTTLAAEGWRGFQCHPRAPHDHIEKVLLSLGETS